MLEKIAYEDIFLANHSWLKSKFHFSFAQYRDFNNINFGALRVLNDDTIAPNSGFDIHPHSDMEIITYIIDGELTHKDSMGNKSVLKNGEVQYMSAGDGVYHSEYNNHPTKPLRLLQIWILPPKKSLPSLYGECKYPIEDRYNKLLNIVSNQQGSSKVKIYQDINMYACILDEQKEIIHPCENDQIYFVLIEGSVLLNDDLILNHGDATKIIDEKELKIKALKDSHFLFIQMPKQ